MEGPNLGRGTAEADPSMILDRQPVLPDFLIRGQAATLGVAHLTNDRRRLRAFPDVDFLFPPAK